MNAAVYARLSQQGEEDESIARQIKLCSDYAIAHNWTPVLYVEPKGARSGYYENKRPAWLQLKKDLTVKPFAAVIVADLYRASRKVTTTLEFVDFLVAHKIEFVALKEKIDPFTAMGRAFLGMSAVFGQLERDNTAERKKIQYRARDKTIYASNRHPFGLTRTGAYPNIVWTPTADFPAILLIAELYVTGHGAPAIAKQLNRSGYKWLNTKGERVPVRRTTIDNTIKAFDRYRPFLDPELFARFEVVRQNQRTRTTQVAATKHPRLMLSGLLYCSHCGTRYKAHGQYKRDTEYRRYQHMNETCARYIPMLRPELVDEQVFARLKFLNHLDKSTLDEIYALSIDQPPAPALDSRMQRDRLMTRLQGYEVMRADGEITKERFLEVKREIETELARLPEPVREAHPNVDADEAYAILKELGDVLPELDSDQLNNYLRLMIAKVWFDGERITDIEWLEPFNLWERQVASRMYE